MKGLGDGLQLLKGRGVASARRRSRVHVHVSAAPPDFSGYLLIPLENCHAKNLLFRCYKYSHEIWRGRLMLSIVSYNIILMCQHTRAGCTAVQIAAAHGASACLLTVTVLLAVDRVGGTWEARRTARRRSTSSHNLQDSK